MSKIIDITDKLNFEEAPKLKVKNVEISLNDDAVTMLKVMQKIGNDVSPADIIEVYNLMIPEEDRKKIDKLELNFKDFQTFVKAAISTVTGMDMDEESAEE